MNSHCLKRGFLLFLIAAGALGIAYAQAYQAQQGKAAGSTFPGASTDEEMKKFQRETIEHFKEEDEKEAKARRAHATPIPALPVYQSQTSRTVTDQNALFQIVDATVSSQTVNPKGSDEGAQLLDPGATRSYLTLRQRVLNGGSPNFRVKETVFTFKHQESGAVYMFDPVFVPRTNQIVFKYGRVDFDDDFFFATFSFDINSQQVRLLGKENGANDNKDIQAEVGLESSSLARYEEDPKTHHLILHVINVANSQDKLLGDIGQSQLLWVPNQGLLYGSGQFVKKRNSDGKIETRLRYDTYLYKPNTRHSVLVRQDANNSTLSSDGRYLVYNAFVTPTKKQAEEIAKDNNKWNDLYNLFLIDLKTNRTRQIDKLHGFQPDTRAILWGDNSHLILFHCIWGDDKQINGHKEVESTVYFYSLNAAQGQPMRLGSADFSSLEAGVDVYPIKVVGHTLVYAIRKLSKKTSFTTLSGRDVSVYSFDTSTKKNTLLYKDRDQFSWSFNVGGQSATVRYVQ